MTEPVKQTTPPTDTPPAGTFNKGGSEDKALKDLTDAMKELRVSMETGTLYNNSATPLTVNTAPSTSSVDIPTDIDLTDPASVRKFINAEMIKVKTDANRAYVQDQARRLYDQLVDQEFPEIQNTSSEIHKETIKEIRKRMGTEGITTLDEMRTKNPSIFYDAACAVSLRLNKNKVLSAPALQTPSPEVRRLSSLTGGFVESGSTPPPPVTKVPEITVEQRFFADRLGVDPKVLGNTVYEKGTDGVYRKR